MKSRFLITALGLALTSSAFTAETYPPDSELRTELEKKKKTLLVQLGAIQELITSVKADDPDRKRDEARRDARLKDLGVVEVELTKLAAATQAKPQKPTDDNSPKPDYKLNEGDWTSYARVKTARELAGQKETIPQEETPATPADKPPGATPASTTDVQTANTVAKLPKHLREAVEAALKEETPVKDYHTFFHTGLRTLAPFTVNKASVVDTSTTATVGFLEFVYSDHWAWRPERRMLAEERRAKAEGDQSLKESLLLSRERKAKFFGSAISDGRNGWDFAGRISFNFGSGDEPGASSITGSGDFATEVMLAKHIFRGWTKTNAYSVSLGGSVAATTDRASLRVHPRYLYGPSYAVSFDDPLSATGTTPRRGLFTLQLGAAYVDGATHMTRLDKEAEKLRNPSLDPTALIVRTVAPGVPRYSLKRGSGIEAELFYPFGKQALVTFGAKAYRLEDSDLAPWSLYIGISTPLSKAAAGFFPK